jgi:hypothetical protein
MCENNEDQIYVMFRNTREPCGQCQNIVRGYIGTDCDHVHV